MIRKNLLSIHTICVSYCVFITLFIGRDKVLLIDKFSRYINSLPISAWLVAGVIRVTIPSINLLVLFVCSIYLIHSCRIGEFNRGSAVTYKTGSVYIRRRKISSVVTKDIALRRRI